MQIYKQTKGTDEIDIIYQCKQSQLRKTTIWSLRESLGQTHGHDEKSQLEYPLVIDLPGLRWDFSLSRTDHLIIDPMNSLYRNTVHRTNMSYVA